MKNRKGFMLAELVVSATVVISTMVGLYALYARLYHLYKEKTNYYSIDGVYATKMIMDLYMRDNYFNVFVNQELQNNVNYVFLIDHTENYIDDSSTEIIMDNVLDGEDNVENFEGELIVDDDDGVGLTEGTNDEPFKEKIEFNGKNAVSEIAHFYQIKKMILVQYDACSLQGKKYNTECNDGSVRDKVDNQTFKEYIDYVVKSYNIDKSDDNYDYIVLAELQGNNDKMYYSNLRII